MAFTTRMRGALLSSVAFLSSTGNLSPGRCDGPKEDNSVNLGTWVTMGGGFVLFCCLWFAKLVIAFEVWRIEFV